MLFVEVDLFIDGNWWLYLRELIVGYVCCCLRLLYYTLPVWSISCCFWGLQNLQTIVKAVSVREGHNLEMMFPITPEIQNYKATPKHAILAIWLDTKLMVLYLRFLRNWVRIYKLILIWWCYLFVFCMLWKVYITLPGFVSFCSLTKPLIWLGAKSGCLDLK